MGGDQGGHPLGLHHGAQQPHDLLRRLRVELAGGLVGQQHLRAAGQRPGDRDPLLLAAGQLARPLPGVLTEPDDVQHEPDPLLPLLRGHPGDPQRHPDVLRRGQDRDEAERLEDERHRRPAELHPLVFGHRGHVPAIDPHLAAVRQVEPADDVEQRGLPRPRPAAQRHQLPGPHAERDAAQRPGGGPAAAERPDHVRHRQHVRRDQAGHDESLRSGQTPMWSGSASSRTRSRMPRGSVISRGSCRRPARSSTAYSTAWWATSPSSPVVARR